MNEQEKLILIKELCARQPYGLKVAYYKKKYTGTLVSVFDSTEDQWGKRYPVITVDDDNYHKVNANDAIPYLRRMNSMTEREKKRYHELMDAIPVLYRNPTQDTDELEESMVYSETSESLDYLRSIHVDNCGLIDKGLALEATEDMYPKPVMETAREIARRIMDCVLYSNDFVNRRDPFNPKRHYGNWIDAIAMNIKTAVEKFGERIFTDEIIETLADGEESDREEAIKKYKLDGLNHAIEEYFEYLQTLDCN